MSTANQTPAAEQADIQAANEQLTANLAALQRQMAILRSCAATALADVRNDQFIEDGDAATAVNLVDSPMVIDTFALLGELQNDLLGGAMLAHPMGRGPG